MAPLVPAQQAGLDKSALAADLRAGKGPLGSVGPEVFAQG